MLFVYNVRATCTVYCFGKNVSRLLIKISMPKTEGVGTFDLSVSSYEEQRPTRFEQCYTDPFHRQDILRNTKSPKILLRHLKYTKQLSPLRPQMRNEIEILISLHLEQTESCIQDSFSIQRWGP